MRAAVTGAAGFVGQWLCRVLLDAGWDVTGAAPPDGETAAGAPVLSAPERDAIRWMHGDVRDEAHLAALVDASRPDAIFHLAGVSHVPAAGRDPALAYDVNALAAARLLEAVRSRRASTNDPLVLIVGSAEQYGRHEDAELPLRESAEQRPHTIYAASKAAQEIIAMQAWRAHGLRVIATRSFNHSGPGQASRFLIPALVERAVRLKHEASAQPLRIGNTGSTRDFLHVSDVVAAYISLAARGEPGEAYNVCSGIGTSAGQLAARVLERVGLDVPVQVDSALQRPVDVPALVGDNTKLRKATDWAPARTLDDIIDDLIHAATH